MRIVIDMQGAQSPYSCERGVGRYTLGMVRAFLRIAASEHEIFLVLNGVFQDTIEPIRAEFTEFLPVNNIKCWQQYVGSVSGISGDIWSRHVAELVREWYISQLNPDIIWSTNLQEGWLDNAVTSIKRFETSAIYCTTLHDVIPLLYPDKYLATDIKYWYYEKIEYTKKSDIILTVSEYTKGKISELIGICDSKIFTAYNSIDKNIFNTTDINEFNCKNLNNIAMDSYILYVGGADDHKNLFKLVLAYSLLPHEVSRNHKMIFVGREVKGNAPHLVNYAKSIGVNPDKLVFLGYVSDTDLAELYRKSGLFIFPSYSEGFGIPPLEAMACGCPVIAANAASLPEVINLSDALFNPFDEHDLASKITLALTDQNYKELLVGNGLARAEFFSWDSSARIILDVFEHVVIHKENNSSCGQVKISSDWDLRYRELIEKLATITSCDEPKLVALAQSIADSVVPCDGRHLYIDLSCLVHKDHATGIQRVVRAITNELLGMEVPGFMVTTVFSYSGHREFYRAEQSDEKHCIPDYGKLIDHAVDFTDGDILLFLDLHPGNAISKKEEIARLRNMGVRVFFVVYDLIPVSHPQYFVKELADEFEQWLRTVICSDGAVCISLDVADKLDNWINDNGLVPARLFKTHYFHLGADVQKSVPSRGVPPDAEELLAKCKDGFTFLMVGTVEPRKGHAYVLDAFEQLWGEGNSYLLIIIGKTGWCNEITMNRIRNHPENGKRLFWLEGISDEYLEKVYTGSTCLIAASECEGFGLPLIEAAQHRLPIIASDIPVFREVAGEYAYYLKDFNPPDLAKAIEDWLDLYKSGEHPKSDNMPYLSWEESAKKLLDILLQKERAK